MAAPQPSSAATNAQRAYYVTVLAPMWRGQLDTLASAMRSHRQHLLAIECLRLAKGDGADPLLLAEFCRTWKTPLTLPLVGPTALLRRAGKLLAGGASPAAAAFDPTGALNMGIKILAQVAPLLAQIQLRNAVLFALDEKVVGRSEQTQVAALLQGALNPQDIVRKLGEAQRLLAKTWEETLSLAEKMEPIRKSLGLPEAP